MREALLKRVASATRDDPQAALLWVSRSQRHSAAALAERDYRASPNLVGRLLKDLGFSLQANAKTREGARHPDRDAQFQHINDAVECFAHSATLEQSLVLRQLGYLAAFDKVSLREAIAGRLG